MSRSRSHSPRYSLPRLQDILLDDTLPSGADTRRDIVSYHLPPLALTPPIPSSSRLPSVAPPAAAAANHPHPKELELIFENRISPSAYDADKLRGSPTEDDSASDSASIPGSSDHVRRHACPTCGRRFNRPSSLRTHMNTHTGETPFQCGKCRRPFNVESNMRRHMRKNCNGVVASPKPSPPPWKTRPLCFGEQ